MEQGNEAFSQACDIIGSQAAMGAAIGLSPSFVSQIISGHRKLPTHFGAAIEMLTGISRKELYPDTWSKYWPDL